MFKEGQIYKVKVELSPDLMGFGRATVVGIDTHRIYIQLRSSKGKLNVPAGTKIWFVGSSLNNRFNGLWSAEVKGSKSIGGLPTIECSVPRFQISVQRRTQSRTELSAPAELHGDEWKDLSGKIITRNISRLGVGFAVEEDCVDRFSPGKTISILIQIGNANLETQVRLVNCRFNWLLNRTEIGAEFIDMTATSVDNLERVLVWLGNRPRGSKAQLSESGSLARWIKAGKDNHSFVKGADPDNDSEPDDEEIEFAIESPDEMNDEI